jgi:hypothetical protein
VPSGRVRDDIGEGAADVHAHAHAGRGRRHLRPSSPPSGRARRRPGTR